MKENEIKEMVKKKYSRIATDQACGCGCGCGPTMTPEEISTSIGYSDEELQLVPEANLGLGCGNPTALGEIKTGQIVLDLGSGAGIDCFLAAKKSGRDREGHWGGHDRGHDIQSTIKC